MKELSVKGKIALLDDEDYEKFKDVNWSLSYGYARGWFEGRVHSLHRLIVGASKDAIVDHVDRNPLNNQKANLRLVTSRFNNLRSLSTNKLRWVYFSKSRGKYYASVPAGGKRKSVGGYNADPLVPFKAALEFMRTHYPELNKDWDEFEANGLKAMNQSK